MCGYLLCSLLGGDWGISCALLERDCVLLVDDRTGSKELAAPLKRLGLPVEVVRLDYGDLAFSGRGDGGATLSIGVELKRLPDLCQSLRSGRLSGYQNVGLSSHYDYRWLVVEGSYDGGRDGRLHAPSRGRSAPVRGSWTLSEVEGRLLTLELCTGLRVRQTHNRAETLSWVVRLYRWWSDRSLDEHSSHLVPHTFATLVPMSRFRQAVCQWPGVGPKVSLAAEQAFKTVRRAANASVEEWAELVAGGKRVGTKTAAAIVQFVQEGERR